MQIRMKDIHQLETVDGLLVVSWMEELCEVCSFDLASLKSSKTMSPIKHTDNEPQITPLHTGIDSTYSTVRKIIYKMVQS